jgi:hypothetical protein
MANVRLISEQYIKQHSIINENVDVKLIIPFVYVAQDTFLEQTLGTDLLAELYSQAPSSFTVLNKTLLDDYITNYLLWLVIKESTPYLVYKYRNKSISTQGGDNATPISNTDVDRMVEKATINANTYGIRLRDYLEENYKDYPLYKRCENKDSVLSRLSLRNNRRQIVNRQIYSRGGDRNE